MIGETVGISIPRNYFDLSQEHIFTAEAGLIYPIYSVLLMPGDIIKVSNQCVIRQQPTINPSFSNYKVKFWDFVVAIRNLDKNIYRFLSGYAEYTNNVKWDKPLPKWVPTSIEKTRPGTLWDFLENPVNCIPPVKYCQLDYFRQAYGYIYDLYFRNETREDSILNQLQEPGSWKGEDLLRVNYDRDYFTTSLPNPTLGEPQAIPISGLASAKFNLNTEEQLTGINAAVKVISNADDSEAFLRTDSQENNALLEKALNNNSIDMSKAASILIRDLTQALAIEALNTINAMAGIRDDEFLNANWGESPSNEALQYPIPFGKSQMEVIVSEVLQTANNTNEKDGVGDLYGHGIGVGESPQDTFQAKEFSIYLKLMYIKTNNLYGSQGIDKAKCQNEIYDFPFPILNHLGMQPITGAELLCISTKRPESNDNGVTITATKDEDELNLEYNDRYLGYKPVYEEYTRKLDKVSGLFIQEQYYEKDSATIKTKDNLYNWTEARFFSIAQEQRPIINKDFLKVKLDNRNYQVVDDTIERSQFLIWHKNIVDCWRSMSKKRLPTMLGVTEGLK
nr:MAG TPA: Major capsid protein [Microviridae sp.]